MRSRNTFNKSFARRDPKGFTNTALYGARGRPGDYDELIYGDSGVLERATRMRTLFGSMDLVVEPVPDETAYEAAFRSRCVSVIAEAREARDDSSSLSDMLEGLVDVVFRGFALWNTWFEEDPSTEWGYRLRFFKVHASTIREWDVDGDGFPVAIKQETVNGSARVELSDCVRVTQWADEGPEGIAMLRPLLFLFEVKKQVLFELGRRASTQAGILTATQSQLADEGAVSDLVDRLDEVVAGEASWLMTPSGYDVSTLAIPSGIDLMPVVDYVDARISQTFDDILSALANKTQGSRALGEVLAEESDWSASMLLDALLRKFARALFGFIAQAVGYTGRMPSLGPNVADTLGADEVLARAQIVAQAIGLREGDEDTLREHAGLPPVAEAGARIEAPAASMPVAFSRSEAETPYRRLAMARTQDERVPEGYDADVEWKRVSEDRARAEDKLYRSIDRLANQIRAEMLSGVADRDRWLPVIQDTYYDYFVERREAMSELAELEARRQRKRLAVEQVEATPSQWTEIQGAMGIAVAAVVMQYSARLAAQADLAASTLWRRLEQEVQEVRVFGRPDKPVTLDGKALAQDAKHAGRLAEQIGRFEGASSTESSGLVPMRLIRSGFEDDDRCDHCEREAGRVVDLLTTPPESIPVLPDPRCFGTASRCRCGWLVIYGQRAEAMQGVMHELP